MTGGPNGFWASTPRILAHAVAGALARERNEQRRAAWAAWMTAALGRVAAMPSLESIMPSDKPAVAKVQTWQEQLAVASAWVAGQS